MTGKAASATQKKSMSKSEKKYHIPSVLHTVPIFKELAAAFHWKDKT